MRYSSQKPTLTSQLLLTAAKTRPLGHKQTGLAAELVDASDVVTIGISLKKIFSPLNMI